MQREIERKMGLLNAYRTRDGDGQKATATHHRGGRRDENGARVEEEERNEGMGRKHIQGRWDSKKKSLLFQELHFSACSKSVWKKELCGLAPRRLAPTDGAN